MAHAPDDYARLVHDERVRVAEAERVAARAARRAARAARRAEKAEKEKAEKEKAEKVEAAEVRAERLAAERAAVMEAQAAQPTATWGIHKLTDWLPGIWDWRGGGGGGAATQGPQPTAPQGGPANLAPAAAQAGGTTAQAPQPTAPQGPGNLAPAAAQGGGTTAQGTAQGNPPGTTRPLRKMKRGRGGRPGDAKRAARKGDEIYDRGLSEARRRTQATTAQAAPDNVAPAPTGGGGTATPAPAQLTASEGRPMKNLKLPQAERPSPETNPYATKKKRRPTASEEGDEW